MDKMKSYTYIKRIQLISNHCHPTYKLVVTENNLIETE